MSHDSSEKNSTGGFGAEASHTSFSGGFGLETLHSSNGGFGVENPSGDYNSNYKRSAGNEIAVESIGNMLDINTDNKAGIAGGAVYLGNVNSYFANNSIEDICDTSEVSNIQSWFEPGSIFDSVIKGVSDLYDKYISPGMKSVENTVSDIDSKILANIEEVSSGGWDSPYRNIQLDGCIDEGVAESDEMQLDGPATDNLRTHGGMDNSNND
jgi:hypothetical protein